MKISDDVKFAIEHLLVTAKKQKILIAGFAFSSEPPMIMNFGNCSDCGEAHVFARLCAISSEKIKAGKVQIENIPPSSGIVH